MNANRGVQGVNLGHLWREQARLREALEQIVSLVADGTFAPVVDRAFPFDQAGEAHAWIQDRRNFGKVLLTP
jgi:NADPH:quinone reductase-like Zn-dependent oxidoreductase